MKRFRIGNSVRVLVVAPIALALLLGTSVLPGGAASTPLPAILSYSGSPNALPTAGGVTTIKATIKYGSSCTLTVSPGLAGFPSTSACSISYAKKVTLPKNPTGLAKQYTFSFSVKNSTGTTKATNTVIIGVGAAPPPISFSPSVLVFPSTGVATQSAPETVTITNNSTTQSQNLLGVAPTGTDLYDFNTGFLPGSCGGELSPGQSCSFSDVFYPQGAGPRTAEVAVTDGSWGGGTVVDYKMEGTAVFATVSLSETSLNFGSWGVRDPSGWTTVTATNAGTVPLKITSIQPAGGNSTDFAYNTNEPGCTQGEITPGSSCQFQIQFTPLNHGLRSTNIEVIDNTAKGMTVIPASGTGEWTTSTLSTGSLAFNPTALYTQGYYLAVTVTNTSSYGLVFNGLSSLTGNDVNDFIYFPNPQSTGACAGNGYVIAPHASCAFDVEFVPIGMGTRTATLEVFDNTLNGSDPGYEQVTLSGTGT
jgi:hypothetical protein